MSNTNVSPITISGQDKRVIYVQNAKRENLLIQGRAKEVCPDNKVGKSQLDSNSNNDKHSLRRNLGKCGDRSTKRELRRRIICGRHMHDYICVNNEST